MVLGDLSQGLHRVNVVFSSLLKILAKEEGGCGGESVALLHQRLEVSIQVTRHPLPPLH